MRSSCGTNTLQHSSFQAALQPPNLVSDAIAAGIQHRLHIRFGQLLWLRLHAADRVSMGEKRRRADGIQGHLFLEGFSELLKITTLEQLNELVELGGLIQQVQLCSRPDDIVWKMNADGIYTSKSAYLAQFIGSYSTIDFTKLWEANSEPKHRFMGWLILHKKLLWLKIFYEDTGPVTGFVACAARPLRILAVSSKNVPTPPWFVERNVRDKAKRFPHRPNWLSHYYVVEHLARAQQKDLPKLDENCY
uniref:Reverse transcriptase zinc-binding domain-containing protein n=1 Tax=Leersia perrieri TaxID=77586 RepID=A0A0D9WD83_9ORYZ